MNILILTSEYPGNYIGSNSGHITPVVHFFAKEWKKQGHNILVIHNAPRYPYFVHALPKNIKDMIMNKVGFSVMGVDYIKEESYMWEGVPVFRLPIIKYVPHGDHPRKIIDRQINKIVQVVENAKFCPDLMICHWPSPQMQLIGKLKSYFNCKAALTLHGLGYLKNKSFNYKKYINDIDVIGFRNHYDAKIGKELLALPYTPYICLSGIPDSYLDNYSVNCDKFSNIDVFRCVYVGRLVERKHVDIAISALDKSNIDNYQFDIIGDGPCMDSLKKLCETRNLSDKVIFHGRMQRTEVMEFNKKAHCFVMISEREPFGLVYLEAMAAKSVVIGSKNEGIDGIIVNSDNGFLVNAGDETELIKVFDLLSGYSKDQYNQLVKNAYNTVNELTDSKVANKYLNDIIHLLNDRNTL